MSERSLSRKGRLTAVCMFVCALIIVGLAVTGVLQLRWAARSPCDEPLLLEAGGFRLELPLSVIPNCANLALSQALWTFMRQMLGLPSGEW
jgi:hypothetical protein